MTEPQRDFFREYHRVQSRAAAGRIVATIAGAAVLCALVGALTVGGMPVPVAMPVPASTPTPAIVDDPAPPAVQDAATLPAPDTTVAAPNPVVSATPVASAPRSWSITIDTTGYQAEIDQCLWVRMDLGIQAPVVGAHNYCGGSAVLEMAMGDLVTLTGTGLDGTYRVSEERLAHAGDDAAAATAGFAAAIILQTCYWVNDGSERLLALVPA